MLPSRCASYTGRCAAFSLVEVLIAMVVVGVILALVLPALTQAKDQSRATRCIDNSRLIGAAFTEYSDNNKGQLVPYRRKSPAPENSVVESKKQGYTYWPDLLSEYAGSHEIWHCPECQHGGDHGFGIGYNQLTDNESMKDPVRNLDDLASPSMTVMFGDTDVISNPDATPDSWVADPNARGQNRLQFEIPESSTWDNPKSKPHRVWNRHLGHANVVYADQHAASIKVSRMGFQEDTKAENRLWDRD